MFDWFEKEKAIIFGAGVVAGLVGLKIAKCPKARAYAVKGLAKGMQAKDAVMEEVTNMRQEAEDICSEAKVMAQQNSETVEAEIVEEEV